MRLAAFAIIVTLAVPAIAQESPKVVTKQDIVYRTVGGEDLKLDLAMPDSGTGPFPAIVVIHGGAWRQGSKNDNRGVLDEFARHGYVAISPQYRFCPKDPFPAQVHDVKAAVRWLRSNARDYKIDPLHIGAVGFSAGGHLSLMLGLTDDDDGLEGDDVPKDAPSSRVQCVVNYFGPADLAADDLPLVSKNFVKDFLGGTPQEKAEAAKLSSPATFATKDDPPTLTFQGTKDPLVPHTQAYTLADALTEAGAPNCRVELIIGGGHGWGGKELERTRNLTIAFFDEHLK
jgi:acetyl esterase/lipase